MYNEANPFTESVARHTRKAGKVTVTEYRRARRGCTALAKAWERRGIADVLAELGVDRSEGRDWRRSGRHPSLRWAA